TTADYRVGRYRPAMDLCNSSDVHRDLRQTVHCYGVPTPRYQHTSLFPWPGASASSRAHARYWHRFHYVLSYWAVRKNFRKPGAPAVFQTDYRSYHQG